MHYVVARDVVFLDYILPILLRRTVGEVEIDDRIVLEVLIFLLRNIDYFGLKRRFSLFLKEKTCICGTNKLYSL